MDQEFLRERQSGGKWGVFVVILGVIVFITLGVFFVLKNNKKILSPIPEKADFEVFFETPTPGPVTPTLTPSVTPKAKKPAAPTVKPTVTDSAAVTPSPTAKP